MGLVPLRYSRQGESTNVQFDRVGSPCDRSSLDLSSNLDPNLLRHYYTWFDGLDVTNMMVLQSLF